jgi:hypothetical protein
MGIKGNGSVAKEILNRLQDVSVNLAPFVDGDIEGLSSVQKGINFKVKDVKAVKHCFNNATDGLGRQAFYYNGRKYSGKILKELIRNAPHLLDMSFAATDGYGYREIRDMPLLPRLNPHSGRRMSKSFNAQFFNDERDYNYEVTSLHAALSEKVCNVHIDVFGFVLRGPYGPFLMPDFGLHSGDELGLKDKAAPHLGRFVAAVANRLPLTRLQLDAKETGNWIAKNVTLDLPNYRSGYRPSVGVSVTPTKNLTLSVKFSAKCGYCRDEEKEEVRMPVPSISDGRSITGGATLRF